MKYLREREEKEEVMLKRYDKRENTEYWAAVLKDLEVQEAKLEERVEVRRYGVDFGERVDSILWTKTSLYLDAVGYKERDKLFCLDRSFLDEVKSS